MPKTATKTSKPKGKPKAAKPVAKPKAAKPVAAKPKAAKPAVKPAAKPKTATKSKTAKPAAAPKATTVLIKKKPPVAKDDKPVSVRATRGASSFKTPPYLLKRPAPVVAKKASGNNTPPGKVNLTSSFLKLQKQRLLQLRDDLMDSMNGVAKDTLGASADGAASSAFGMHQADAGSDAYDRDFALNLLSQEQDALYEIDDAIKRLNLGSYGICEMSGKPIPVERLEARPYARFTVECQAQVDRDYGPTGQRRAIRSLFGLGGDDDDDDGDDDSVEDKD
ncbi:MAG: TraR/DksA family transcriptional regulator [Verrucomicrobiales bacterium]|nr:TraR/DksA family transcriptional regulator [Verrucomicrobiales bacterium]